MATGIKSGQTITGTTSEVGYTLTGSHEAPLTTVTLELLTGSYRYAVARIGSAPVISDTGYTVISTANDKKLVTMSPGSEELRIKGTSTIHVSY